MKIITYSDIFKMNPCYEPNRYIPKTWTGTVLDILNLEQVPVKDRLWVILQSKYLSDKTMRLFAVTCAKRVSHLCQDDRSLKAIEVAERFANGEAAVAELDAAGAAAWDAARAAAGDTAGAAAWDAARAVAWGAARTAAWSAARAAAWSAALDAALAAARAAAWGAAWSAARGAAWNTARDVEEAEQIKILRELILKEKK